MSTDELYIYKKDTESLYYGAMRLAYECATWSPDPSTQVGAIIINEDTGQVLGMGCNDFPAGVLVTEERLERPLKYDFIEHGERNAIFNALSNGNDIKNMTMVATWASCAGCARAIIGAGLKKVVTHDFYFGSIGEENTESKGVIWSDSILSAHRMFAETGVKLEFYSGNGKTPIMKDHEIGLLYQGEYIKF